MISTRGISIERPQYLDVVNCPTDYLKLMTNEQLHGGHGAAGWDPTGSLMGEKVHYHLDKSGNSSSHMADMAGRPAAIDDCPSISFNHLNPAMAGAAIQPCPGSKEFTGLGGSPNAEGCPEPWLMLLGDGTHAAKQRVKQLKQQIVVSKMRNHQHG